MASAPALLFAGLSATVILSRTGLHTFEVTFFRNFFGLVFMLPWLWRQAWAASGRGGSWLYGWRSAVSLVSMLCGFTSLALLPFANAITLSFTAPLFATIGAALILGEDVRVRRWSATLRRLHRRA